MARLLQAPMISPELSEYIRLIVLSPLKYRRAEVVSSRFLDAIGQNSFNLVFMSLRIKALVAPVRASMVRETR
jgi:hypothetical protein